MPYITFILDYAVCITIIKKTQNNNPIITPAPHSPFLLVMHSERIALKSENRGWVSHVALLLWKQLKSSSSWIWLCASLVQKLTIALFRFFTALRCNPKWRVSITTNRLEKITAARITFIICCVFKIIKFYYHFL